MKPDEKKKDKKEKDGKRREEKEEERKVRRDGSGDKYREKSSIK